MKTNTIKTAIIGLIAVGLVSMGTVAFAGKGMGYRDDDGANGGGGRYQQEYDCPYGNRQANLSPEQRNKLDAERQDFFEATKTQRQDLYAKRLELRAEMAKRDADIKKAEALQKEISDLQGNLDQQRLKHIMKMRDIDPDAGMGLYGGGRGMGGYGHHRGDGPGFCRQ